MIRRGQGRRDITLVGRVEELQVLLIRSCELISLPARSPEHAGNEVGMAAAAAAPATMYFY